MLRAWRTAGIAALVTGVAVAAQLAGVGPAQASAAPTITIAATTKFKPVTGDYLVIDHLSAYDSAKLHGTITHAVVGEVAALYAQQFPFKEPAVRIGSLRLRAAKTAYSFTVTPVLATHYAVRVFATGSATAVPLAVSRTQGLYVTTDQSTNAPQKCSRPVCHEVFHIDTYVPDSALSVEMGKHLDAYFGISLGSAGIPAKPKWLYLNAGHAQGHQVAPDLGGRVRGHRCLSRLPSATAVTASSRTSAPGTPNPRTASACPATTTAAPAGFRRTWTTWASEGGRRGRPAAGRRRRRRCSGLGRPGRRHRARGRARRRTRRRSYRRPTR